MQNNNKNLKPINLNEKLRPYEGKWVALSLDNKRVLGAGDTLEETKKKAEKKSKDYIFIKLPPYDLSYVPSFSA